VNKLHLFFMVSFCWWVNHHWLFNFGYSRINIIHWSFKQRRI